MERNSVVFDVVEIGAWELRPGVHSSRDLADEASALLSSSLLGAAFGFQQAAGGVGSRLAGRLGGGA
jgi:hypothetical protein